MSEPTEDRATRTDFIELPAATAWPMIAALGIALGFAGLVTHGVVTMVGVVLTIAGVVGWWRDVLPVEDVERIALPPPARRAEPIAPSRRKVEHLVVGGGASRRTCRNRSIPTPPASGAGSPAPSRWPRWRCSTASSPTAASGIPSICWPAWRCRRWRSAELAQLKAFNGVALAVASVAHVIDLDLRRAGLRRDAADLSAPRRTAGAALSPRWCGPACCGRRSA